MWAEKDLGVGPLNNTVAGGQPLIVVLPVYQWRRPRIVVQRDL